VIQVKRSRWAPGVGRSTWIVSVPTPWRAVITALLSVVACKGDRPPMPAAEISLAVSGGPNAGTVTVRSAEVICTEGIVGGGSWGVQYTDPELTSRLGSMQVIVPNAGPEGTARQFYLGLVFQSFLAGTNHEIETRDSAGRASGGGTVSIQRQDSSASLTITGHTEDGVGISATVRCGQVRHLSAPIRPIPLAMKTQRTLRHINGGSRER
jgi:hypothetical protein